MSNTFFDQLLAFDVELSALVPNNAIPTLLGTLTNKPVILFFKNQTDGEMFVSDQNSETIGMTMAIGEEVVLDCRANHGVAGNMSFPIGTSFYITGSSTLGSFRISILYAK